MKYTFEYSTKTENNLVHTVTAGTQKEALEKLHSEVGEDIYFVEIKEKKGLTAAQYRATRKYSEKNIMRLELNFNRKTEPELCEFVCSLDNKAGLIKRLLTEEMKRRSQ